MAPQDLVEVAGEMADVEDAALPIQQLASVATVGDLQVLLSRAIAREKPLHAFERVA